MNNMLSDKDKQAILDLLVEQLGVQRAELTPGAKIKEDLRADSLTVIEIAMAMEERFHLSIPDEQWETVATVNDLLETMARFLPAPDTESAGTVKSLVSSPAGDQAGS
jgi:acyl carrier protein